ncbi:hypothetical protein Tsubulata_026458, partial [Turnera subulata]
IRRLLPLPQPPIPAQRPVIRLLHRGPPCPLLPDQNPDASVIILSGSGDNFCAGIDVKVFSTLTSLSSCYLDTAHASEYLRRHAKFLQDAVTAIQRCCKPVIAVVRGACICRGRGYYHRL